MRIILSKSVMAAKSKGRKHIYREGAKKKAEQAAPSSTKRYSAQAGLTGYLKCHRKTQWQGRKS